MPLTRDDSHSNQLIAYTVLLVATFKHRRTGRIVSVPDDQAHRYSDERRWTPVSAEPQAVQFQVPDGSVAEVLEWVGDDPDRRAAALAAEKAGKGRKTLIKALTK
jgi:hypothetical protein